MPAEVPEEQLPRLRRIPPEEFTALLKVIEQASKVRWIFEHARARIDKISEQ